MKNETLRAMISALDDVRADGDTFQMGDNWDFTLHTAHRQGGMQITHVTALTLKGEHVVVTTSKGSRFVLDVEGIFGFGQEPVKGERSGRRAGFA
jgi:hypothetical protein